MNVEAFWGDWAQIFGAWTQCALKIMCVLLALARQINEEKTLESLMEDHHKCSFTNTGRFLMKWLQYPNRDALGNKSGQILVNMGEHAKR